MPTTYEPIESITLTSHNTVTFTNIPGTYTDLKLVFSGGNDVNFWDIRMRINSDSNTNYSFMYMRSSEGSTSYGRSSSQNQIISASSGADSSLNSMMIADFIDYSNSTTFKSVLIRGSAAGYLSPISATVGLWRSTNPITSILIFAGASNNGTANLRSGTNITLYGIKAA